MRVDHVTAIKGEIEAWDASVDEMKRLYAGQKTF